MSAAVRVGEPGREREDRSRAASCVRAHAMPICIVPHSPSKKRITIEDLLVWAYRDQMVHAARGAAVPDELAMDWGTGYGNGGPSVDIVDSSIKMQFKAAPDAYVVHEAVSGLARVNRELPADAFGRFSSLDLSRGSLPDAERRVTIGRSQLVMTSALDAHAPDWVEKPQINVVRGEVIWSRYPNGEIKRDKRKLPIASLQLVRFEGDMPWDVARARLVYSEWVEALGYLRGQLASMLDAFSLSDVLPPAAPWI